MADSFVYGPESVTSVGIALRSRIAPAISDQPPAPDGPKNDGPNFNGPKIAWPESHGLENDGPGSRFEGWALGSSTLGSSTLGSNHGAGAAAARPGGQGPAQGAELANILRCMVAYRQILTFGILRLPRSL